MEEDLRLQLYLSRSGVASRRAAADIIKSGRVTVNGKQCKEPGQRVQPDDSIALDGNLLSLEDENVYLAFNKPAQVICTADDPEGRITIYDIISESYPHLRLFSAGRLDFLSTGLMIVTNDGTFANLLSHPRSETIKKYQVEAKEPIPREMLEEWSSGVRVRGVLYRLKNFYFESPKSVVLSLTEGKNREIRNVFAHYRINIRKLHRIQYGSIAIGNLKEGKYRNLSSDEIRTLKSDAQKRRMTSQPPTRSRKKPSGAAKTSSSRFENKTGTIVASSGRPKSASKSGPYKGSKTGPSGSRKPGLSKGPKSGSRPAPKSRGKRQ